MGKLLRLLSLRRNPHSVSRFRLGSIWLPLTILLVTALLPKPVMDCKATCRGAECGSKMHPQTEKPESLSEILLGNE